MGKGSPSAPPAPDPAAAARAQGVADLNTAIAQGYMNRTNQTTPFGSSIYNQIGTETVDGRDVPMFEQIVSLSPEQQQLFDRSNQIGTELLDIGSNQLGRIQSTFDVPLDFTSLPPTMSQEYGTGVREQVEDALYNRHLTRLDPEWERRQTQFQDQLINQGFARGGDAYKDAFRDFSNARNDAYQGARTAAIAGGGAEQAREQGLRLTDRNQAIQEMLTGRGQPLNELAALMGTSPGVQMPQFQAPPQVSMSSPDVIGAIYGSNAADRANYNARLQSDAAARGGMYGLLGTLGAGAMMSPWMGSALGLGSTLSFPSDPKLKTDRKSTKNEDFLNALNDLPIETWRYKGEDKPRIGPMADKWAKKFGGDGHVIPAPTAFGVTLGAIKALNEKIDNLMKDV